MKIRSAGFRRIIVSLACMAILVIHSSFFSFSREAATAASPEVAVTNAFLANTNPFFKVSVLHSFYLSKTAIYDSLQLDAAGLNREAFEWGLRGMEKLIAEGRAGSRQILSIADFSQPSYQKRLYVIDLGNYSLLFNTWVAHGKNSGKEMAASFSNRQSSNMSSLGFYLTGNTYTGKHGYSLKLQGLEKGFNDNALNRAIVVHGADYVNEAYASSQGYIGRSMGCPALPKNVYRPIIDQIKEGTCLFIYYPSHNYLKKSGLLN